MSEDNQPAAAVERETGAALASTRALLGLFLAGTVGIIIFLFVHLSADPKKGIELGPAHASACDKGSQNCLPEVTFVDTSGHAFTAKELAGKVVVVNFWATWCHPCEKEIPDLSRAYDKYKAQGVVFLGVMADQPSPDAQALLNFQSDHEMTYPVVRVNPELLQSFDYPENLPTTFVFDRSGPRVDVDHNQRFFHLGAITEKRLSSVLDSLVASR
jgi:thiol-disulfide isomerase/thioredoxin